MWPQDVMLPLETMNNTTPDVLIEHEREDSCDSRWSDTDWGWLAFFGDDEPEFEAY